MKNPMNWKWVTGGFICMLLLTPAKGFGNAYFVDSMDGKATGMADAFTAVADDPAAVYYNPAGIVQLDGTRLSSGLTFVDVKDTSFESNGTSAFGNAGEKTYARPTQVYIPSLFATHKLNDALSFGFGVFANFGLSTDWPDGWEGRYIAGGTKAEISTATFNPVAAYRLNEKISISGGLVLQKADVTLESMVPVVVGETVYPDATLRLKGDNMVSVGYNLALLAWVNDNVKFGMSYRSAMRHDVDGDFNIAGTPGGAGDAADNFSTTLTLPALLYTGVAYVKGPLTVDFDVLWVQWSTIEDMEIDFDTLPTSTSHKGWDNTLTYRLGASYGITEAVALRTGVEYSNNPIPGDTLEPTTPTNDRWRLCIGGGYKTGNITLDLGYNYLFWTDKRNYNNMTGDYGAAGRVTGEFDVPAHLIAATVGYKF